MRPNRTRTTRAIALLAVPLLTLSLVACSSDDASDSTIAAETAAAETAAADTIAAADTAAADTIATETTIAADTAAAAPVALSAACAKDALALVSAGTLTIATDKPAYSPWFTDDDPSNGKGFEGAVAYAVAETLGFTPDEVAWKTVPFNSSYAPGKKDFDFDINQISITEERKAVVDFSDGYYSVNQAVVALSDSPIASATTIAELGKYKFGAQVGTTSLEFIKGTVKPSQESFVYDDTAAAKSALVGKQIDAIVVDLPTAFYISAAEIEGSKVVGQFASAPGGEEFGLLFEKGSKLVPCVNEALAALKSSGRLAAIQEAELATATDVPVFE